MSSGLSSIVEHHRFPSPAATPQALAWHEGTLWLSSRDERRFFSVDPETWVIREEITTPDIVWSAVSARGELYLTSGEGAEDDRYLRRCVPGRGLDANYRVAQPDLTGSYLSFDGQALYLSQWYKHRVLQLGFDGAVSRTIPIGAEISGHVFAHGVLYVLRGTEQNGEEWRIARVALDEANPLVEDLAQVPFACRSLTFDGEHFWTNHRAANETVSFSLPPGHA